MKFPTNTISQPTNIVIFRRQTPFTRTFVCSTTTPFFAGVNKSENGLNSWPTNDIHHDGKGKVLGQSVTIVRLAVNSSERFHG